MREFALERVSTPGSRYNSRDPATLVPDVVISGSRGAAFSEPPRNGVAPRVERR